MFTKDMHVTELIDFYGNILSDSKRNIMELYYSEDYSLSEIASNTGISRQGVRDSIKKSELELIDLENKLHLSAKFKQINQIISDTIETVNSMDDSLEKDKVLQQLNSINL